MKLKEIFKSACERCACGKPIVTIHTEVTENKNVREEMGSRFTGNNIRKIYKVEDRYKFEWYGMFIGSEEVPISILINASCDVPTGQKKISIQYKTPYPTYDALKFLSEMEEQLKGEVESILKKEDKERLKRITEGRLVEEEFHYEKSDHSLLKKQDNEFELDHFEKAVDYLSSLCVNMGNYTGSKAGKSILLYGKRGSLVAEILKSKRIAEYTEIAEGTYWFKMKFPFQSGMDERVLSDNYFNFTTINEMKKFGLFVEVRNYDNPKQS